MKIWKLGNDNTVQINVTDFEENYDKFFSSQFNGTPIKEWGDIEMEIYKGKGLKADNLYFGPGALIFSLRAVNLLQPLLGSAVEVKSLIHKPYPIAAINVLNVIDCIDHVNALAETLPSGTIIGYEKFAFIEEKLIDQHIFKIQNFGKTMYVSDEFRECVTENKLKGFRFQELWDSNATNEPINAIDDLVIADNEGLSYSEAMDLVEKGDVAVINSKYEKWQMNKKGKVVLGHLTKDGIYMWIEPVYVPIPHLSMRWIVTEKSDI